MIQDKIILGTVQMGLSYGINNPNGQIGSFESHEILTKAFNEGIKVLDTAEAYGEAHQVIGDFHRSNPDMKFKIITKLKPSDNLINIESKILQYLSELNVEQLEALMFHSLQSYMNHKDLLADIKHLKSNDIIKNLGVSVYTNDELERLIDDKNIDIIQLPFNLLDNASLRGELLKTAKKKGKIIHTRSAFLQGLFFKNPSDRHPVVQALQKDLIRIHTIAQDQGVSVMSLSLGYCLSQPFIDQVLIGVDSLSQLSENLDALYYQPDNEVIQAINEIKTEHINLLNPSNWVN